MNEKTINNDLICVGAIAGAFGVKGEVKVKSFTDNSEDIFRYGPLLGDDGAVILTPQSHRPVKDGFAVTAPSIKTPEAANVLKSVKLFVARESLPETDEDEFYYADLIGLAVKTVDGKNAGTVTAIHEFGAGDLLEILPPKKDGKQAQSFYHSFTKVAVPKVDIKAGRAITHAAIANSLLRAIGQRVACLFPSSDRAGVVLQWVVAAHVGQGNIRFTVPCHWHERRFGAIDVINVCDKSGGQCFGRIEVHIDIHDVSTDSGRAAERVIFRHDSHTIPVAHIGHSNCETN